MENVLKPGIKLKPFLAAVIFGIIIYLIPRPAAVSLKGWHLFAVFLSILLGSALNAVSIGLASFIGIFFLIATHTITTQTALSLLHLSP